MKVELAPKNKCTAKIPQENWRTLIFCIVYPGITFTVFAATFPLWVVPWMVEFDAPRSLLMSGIAMGSLVSLMLAPVVGRLIDLVPVRYMIAAGASVLSLSLTLAAFAQEAILIVALYATIISAGRAFAGTLPAQTISIRLFPEHASFINSLVVLGPSLLGALMVPLAAITLAELGWRNSFLAEAAIVLLIVPIALIVIKPQPRAQQGEISGKQPALDVDELALSSSAILRSRTFWLPLLAAIPVLAAYTAIQPNIALIGVDSGLSLSAASYAVSAIPIGSIFGTLGVGWLADRLDHRLIYLAISATMIIAFLLLKAGGGPQVLTVASLALGLTAGGGAPLIGAIVIKHFGTEAFPQVFGLMSPFFLPGLAGPILAGWIRDVSGSYDAAFMLFTVLLVPGLMAMYLLGSPRIATTSDPSALPDDA